jgi:hypothetical protein
MQILPLGASQIENYVTIAAPCDDDFLTMFYSSRRRILHGLKSINHFQLMSEGAEISQIVWQLRKASKR